MRFMPFQTTVARGQKHRGAAIAALGLAAAMAVAVPAFAHEGHGHPARIHEGSCEDLGAVAYRLNGVGANVDLDGAPLATPRAINPDSSYQIMVSDTTIDGQLSDLLASGHAVMVYESDDDMSAIACGNIGGVMHGDALIAALAESGVPGHNGFAIFQPESAGTLVSIILGHAVAPVSASGAGQATAVAGSEAAHEDEDAHHEHDEEQSHDAVATPEA